MSSFDDGMFMGMGMSRRYDAPDINSIREQLLAEMRQTGMLLPQYDWQSKELDDTLESITADWFARHPETKRGSGAFQK